MLNWRQSSDIALVKPVTACLEAVYLNAFVAAVFQNEDNQSERTATFKMKE
jgi:hypothetical protein